MKKRQLRNIAVSEIGMGCMGLSHGYGAIPSEECSIASIRAAFDSGCTFFDTAEGYSPNLQGLGHNEKILGKALKGIREEAVIATKQHLLADEVRAKGLYAAVRTHLEGSLSRLGTDRVDLYYLHRVNREIPVGAVAEAMGRLIEEGLIAGWGLSQVGIDTLRAAHAVTPLSAVQNIYSMMERSSEAEVIPYCMANCIGFVPFSPVASGFLSGKVSSQTDFSQPDDVRKFIPQLSADNIGGNGKLLSLVRKFAQQKSATMAQISLAWILHKYPNAVPIPGSKNQERILENLGACAVSFTKAEFSELEAELSKAPVMGFRGHIEFEGDTMKDWGRRE